MPRKIKQSAGWESPKVSAADRKLAAEGHAREAEGKKPKLDQSRAIRRIARIEDEAARHAIYGSISKKHWRLMSGRADKILNEQAVRYGLPIGGPKISLHDLAPALHDFLATHALTLSGQSGKKAETDLDPLQRLRAEKLEIQIAELRGQYVPIEQFRSGIEPFIGSMRRAGETLRKVFGADAAQVLDDAMTEGLREIGATMGVEETC